MGGNFSKPTSATFNSSTSPSAGGVHPGVTCDKTGQCPIVGNRYHLVGHNYDLCEAEYVKLTDKEKALFQLIPPPAAPFVHPMPNASAASEANANGAAAAGGGNAAPGVHPGVECDRSGMCPIVGTRYNLKGHNYDLCQAEYDKLPQAEKLLYAAIPPPQTGCGGGGWGNGHSRCPWRRGPGGQGAGTGGGMGGGA